MPLYSYYKKPLNISFLHLLRVQSIQTINLVVYANVASQAFQLYLRLLPSLVLLFRVQSIQTIVLVVYSM